MVESLPRAVRLKLEQALGQWRHWRCDPVLPGAPHIDKVLSQGHSNWSVVVGAAGRRFVVRIDGVNTAANGINRQHEWRVLQAAGAAGIAPMPRYFNPELGALVCDYLPPDPGQREDLANVARLVRGIHQLPVGHQRLDLAQRLARYDHWMERDNPDGLAMLLSYRPSVARQLDACNAQSTPYVLCHNDLLRANRLYSGGRLYALDWEYATAASPWHDLAVIVFGDDLGVEQGSQLFDCYLERPANEQEWRLLQSHGAVYRYLELAWYLAQGRPLLDEEAIASRQSRLAELLQEIGS